jgi:hypothetical protein
MVAVVMWPESAKIVIAIRGQYGIIVGRADHLYAFEFLESNADISEAAHFLFADYMHCGATYMNDATVLNDCLDCFVRQAASIAALPGVLGQIGVALG